MTFANTQLLFLIWALPALLMVFLYGFNRRRSILSRFSSDHGLSSTAPERSPERRWIKAGLVLSSALFLIVAVSGPQYGYRWEEAPRKGIDIIIALDCSRSMLAEDVSPSRLERAKREIVDLIAMFECDRVGLVAFAGTAFLQCPLTTDYSIFSVFLNTLSPEAMPVGGTDLPGAVNTALQSFDPNAHAEKAVILITDGESTTGDPMNAAAASAKAGVKLFCIGVGHPEGVPVPGLNGGLFKDRRGDIVVTRLDEDTLKRMALATGGTYVRSIAGDLDLEAMYRQHIRGKMAAAKIETGKRQVHSNRFQWFLLVSAILLIAEMMLPAARRKAAVVIALAVVLAATPADAASAASAVKEGIGAYQNGEYESALSAFISAQLERPQDPTLAFNIGSAYYKLSQFDAAQHQFETATRSEDPALRQKALYNLGNTRFRLGDIEGAIDHYQKALDIAPEDEMAQKNLAFAKEMLQRQPQSQDTPQGGDHSEENPSAGENDTGGDASGNEHRQGDQGKPQGKNNSAEKNGNRMSFGDEQAGTADPKKPAGSETKSGEASPHRQADPSAATDDGGKGETSAGLSHKLNRLKDQPGKALVPAYQPRQVEKDW